MHKCKTLTSTINEKWREYNLETQMFLDYEKDFTAYKDKFYLMF